jgi:hypothetical protein
MNLWKCLDVMLKYASEDLSSVSKRAWSIESVQITLLSVYMFFCLETGVRHLFKEPEDYFLYIGIWFLSSYFVHLCMIFKN